jgi:hypothetical protein
MEAAAPGRQADRGAKHERGLPWAQDRFTPQFPRLMKLLVAAYPRTPGGLRRATYSHAQIIRLRMPQGPRDDFSNLTEAITCRWRLR